MVTIILWLITIIVGMYIARKDKEKELNKEIIANKIALQYALLQLDQKEASFSTACDIVKKNEYLDLEYPERGKYEYRAQEIYRKANNYIK